MGEVVPPHETLPVQPASTSGSALEWKEPKWSYQARIKAELAPVFGLKMWLRVLAAVVVLAAAMAYLVEHQFHGLIEFNWVRNVILSFLVLAGGLGLRIGAFWFFAPTIRISAKGISRETESQHWRLRKEIRSILVDARDRLHPVMNVVNSKRTFAAGIGSDVEVGQLVSFLRQTFPEVPVEVKR
jgi:hypothetical protein